MSNKPILAVSIIINFLLLAALLFLNQSSNDQELSELESTFSKSNALLKDQSKHIWMNTQPALENWNKYKLITREKVAQLRDTLDRDIDKLQNVKFNERGKAAAIVTNSQNYILEAYAEIFSVLAPLGKLKQDEIDERIQHLHRALGEPAYISSNPEVHTLFIAKEINHLRQLEYHALFDIWQMIPSGAFIGTYESNRIVVIPESYTVKAGEVFNAQIRIGHFIGDPFNTVGFNINAQPYQFKDNSIIYSETAPMDTGMHKITITPIGTSVLTGEKLRGSENYYYRVVN